MELVENGKVNRYKNHRTEPYFSYVKNGTKRVEGRLKKGLYAELKEGDQILVQNNDESDSVLVSVTAVRTYRDFHEMLTKETLTQVLPNATSIEHGIKLYEQFYSVTDQEKYGVLAIEVERV